MLAMLRKDVYVMGKYTAVFTISWIVIAGLFGRISGTSRGPSLYYLMSVMASTIVLTAVSSDQECRWDRFIAVSPLRPWQIVLAKYLFAYIVLTLTSVLGALAGWIITRDTDRSGMWFAVAAVLLVTAMDLPLVYRFGRQRGARIITVIFLSVFLAIVKLGYERIRDIFRWLEIAPAVTLAAGLGGTLLALNAASLLLSIRFYSRRQRG